MKRRTVRNLLVLSVPFLATNIAFSTYIVLGSFGFDVKGVVETGQAPICYVMTNGVKRNFITIDAALKKMQGNGTADTLYVNLNVADPENKRYKITQSATIEAGDTLVLPYREEPKKDDKNEKNLIFWSENDSNQNDYDAFTKESQHKKLEVTVSKGVTLTNSGTIQIGGVQSGGNGGFDRSGQTGGDYAVLSLAEGATLDSYGTTNCYGYLRGVGEGANAIFRKNSSTTTLYAIREHRGGTIFSNLHTTGGLKFIGSPFNRFYIANIMDINYRFESGSSFYSVADLYASGKHNRTNIHLLGKGDAFLVDLGDGAVVEGRFDSGGGKETSVNSLNFKGSLSVHSMSLNAAGYSVSTKDCLFPLSWYWNINLMPFEEKTKKTETTANCGSQGFKLLPGNCLTIHKGVSVTIKRLAVYKSFKDEKAGCPTVYSDDSKNDSSRMNPAALFVNGSLEVTENLGGIIKTAQSGSILSISGKPGGNSPGNSIDSYEVKSKILNLIVTKKEIGKWEKTQYWAEGPVNASNNLQNLSAKSKYISGGDYWVKQ